MVRGERTLRSSHHQTTVLHSLEADHTIGELLDLRRLAVDDEHFKAGVVETISSWYSC